MELWLIKIICVIILLVITLLFGLIPFKIVSVLEGRMEWRSTRPRANFIMGCLNSFGGGVFLGTAFFHLLPEVTEQFGEVFEQVGSTPKFPVTEGVILAGFFVVMLLEHVILTLQHHHSDVSFSTESSQSGRTTDSERTPVLQGHGHQNQKITWQTSYGAIDAPSTSQDQGQHDEQGVTSDKRQRSHSVRKLDVKETGECTHVIEASHHEFHHQNPKQLQGVRSFVLLVALSLHTIFEGLALGLQRVESQIWTLLLALAIHKIIIAFTLGLRFAENIQSRKQALIFIVIFSFMAPLGVAIGTGITEGAAQSLAQNIASSSLQALATGTFLYVTFFEILHKEVGQDHSLIKVVCIIVGSACMGALVLAE